MDFKHFIVDTLINDDNKLKYGSKYCFPRNFANCKTHLTKILVKIHRYLHKL